MIVGFQAVAQDERAEFCIQDHGHKDRPPLVTQVAASGVRLVLIGRLHYRTDLRAGLDLREPEFRDDAEGSDAALALAMYRRQGVEGLERLEGDFALLIWDEGRRRLIAMRDPTGGYPVFYTARNGLIRASTCMQPLLDTSPDRTLNEEYLADYLVLPGWDMEEVPDGRTAWQGIQRVPAGSIVVFHTSSGKVEQRHYWDWLQRQVDPGTDDFGQLGEQFRDRLQAAVRTRLRGRSGSHLSGGMDSTAVALIARDCLDGVEPLHAVSLVYQRLRWLARERPYLESALQQPGLVPHRINGDDILDFSFDSAPPHDEPCPWLHRIGV